MRDDGSGNCHFELYLHAGERVAHPVTPDRRIDGGLHDRAVVMFSGGLDSTVALWWAVAHYRSVHVLSLDYGQPHRQELAAARRIARLSPAQHATIKLSLPDWHRPGPGLFLRGHGALISALAALGIDQAGADIIVGALATDPYSDATADYFTTVAAGFAGPDDQRPTRILTPLRTLRDKTAVADLGFELGAPWHLTWSCRTPQNGRPCQRCGPCASRASAIAGVEDNHSAHTVAAWQAVLGSPVHATVTDSPDLQELARQVAAIGVAETPYRRYRGPDESTRITPLTTRTPHIRRRNRQCALRTRGVTPTGEPWEVIICDNGTVATAGNPPDAATVRSAILATVERTTALLSGDLLDQGLLDHLRVEEGRPPLSLPSLTFHRAVAPVIEDPQREAVGFLALRSNRHHGHSMSGAKRPVYPLGTAEELLNLLPFEQYRPRPKPPINPLPHQHGQCVLEMGQSVLIEAFPVRISRSHKGMFLLQPRLHFSQSPIVLLLLVRASFAQLILETHSRQHRLRHVLCGYRSGPSRAAWKCDLRSLKDAPDLH